MTPKIYIVQQQGSPHHPASGLDHCEDPEVGKNVYIEFLSWIIYHRSPRPTSEFYKDILELTLYGMHMF